MAKWTPSRGHSEGQIQAANSQLYHVSCMQDVRQFQRERWLGAAHKTLPVLNGRANPPPKRGIQPRDTEYKYEYNLSLNHHNYYFFFLYRQRSEPHMQPNPMFLK